MDYYKNIDHFQLPPDRSATGVNYTVITDLINEPVDIDFFKEHARIDFDTDDNLVAAYIKASRQELEKWSQLSFGVKTIALSALTLPRNYKLMYGKVDTILTPNYTHFHGILREGGTNVVLEFTTLDWIDETIKIAICRNAAALYMNRENYVSSEMSAQALQNEAKTMLNPYRNITLV